MNNPSWIQEINKLSQQYLKFKNLEDIEQLSERERAQILDILNKFFGLFYHTFQEIKKEKSDCHIPSKHSSVKREKSDTDYTRPRKIRKKISLPCFKEESSTLESDIKKEKTTDDSSIILKSFLGFDTDDFDNMISKLPLNRIYSSRSLAVSLHSRIREYQLSHFETRKICEHTLLLIDNGIKMIDKIIEDIEITNIFTLSDVEKEINEFYKFSSNTFDVF